MGGVEGRKRGKNEKGKEKETTTREKRNKVEKEGRERGI